MASGSGGRGPWSRPRAWPRGWVSGGPAHGAGCVWRPGGLGRPLPTGCAAPTCGASVRRFFSMDSTPGAAAAVVDVPPRGADPDLGSAALTMVYSFFTLPAPSPRPASAVDRRQPPTFGRGRHINRALRRPAQAACQRSVPTPPPSPPPVSLRLWPHPPPPAPPRSVIHGHAPPHSLPLPHPRRPPPHVGVGVGGAPPLAHPRHHPRVDGHVGHAHLPRRHPRAGR